MKQLEKKLLRISKVFDINEVLNVKVNKEYIAKYYKVNQLAYSIFHTVSDRIYMGVSRDGKYKKEDLLEAARTVEHYIKEISAKSVLELATGRGANSFYLAKRHPDISFQGLDISEGQLYFAQKKSRMAPNYSPKLGDYHNLDRYEDSSIDICFVVEALCYSTDKGAVLKEVRRVLKPGGIFIIFDGYLAKPEETLTEKGKLASKLTEIGMAVEKFEEYEDFNKTIKSSGLSILKEEDVSVFVLPTMKRFEKLAKAFFKIPPLAKLISKILPEEFTYNAISGYLMPALIEEGIASYVITILKK
ncbi:class I SAM-dependent methyltransferase [Candidatus Dojkabacteria bacterium]|nr:class I SAM-dependent methyltransferase [Candidatus Dojkabacteria bacterium]